MMRIYYSTNSDPMIYGSIDELSETYSKLGCFLDSDQSEMVLRCDASVSPEPYEQCLLYIKFVKSSLNSVSVVMDSNLGLVIDGMTELLYTYIEAFKFVDGEEGQHHHPDFSISSKNNIWPFVECSD